ncbi:MAG: hypothetical protein ACREJC_19610 [Tepidisphaeraceae bacterium]
MHIREIDWRHSWISQTLDALDQGLASLRADFSDGIDLLEHAETLVGLGYVAIQVYIRGASEDLASLFPSCPKVTVLRSSESAVVNDANLTHIESIWAAANYFKHHEEWRDWERDARKDTLSALKKLGISAKTEFPCAKVLQRLQGDDWQLASLLDVAKSWRESWLLKLRDSVP